MALERPGPAVEVELQVPQSRMMNQNRIAEGGWVLRIVEVEKVLLKIWRSVVEQHWVPLLAASPLVVDDGFLSVAEGVERLY